MKNGFKYGIYPLMLWKKKSDWDEVAPSSPSAIRLSLVAIQNYKKLVVLPGEPVSKDFNSKIDLLAEEATSIADDKYERLAEVLGATVTSFADSQQKSFERSIDSVHETMRELILSLDGAANSSDMLETATEQSHIRLDALQKERNYEAIIQGLRAEVTYLSNAVQRHKKDSKLIRQVCAQQIDLLRGKVRTAERAVRTDHLTNLHNRAAFDFLMTSILSKVKGGETYCLSVLDLNNFKSINDSHGHLCGDAALVEFSNRINETFGSTSAQIARFGGDEFSIIFKGTPVQLEAKLERLNHSFEKRPLLYQETKIQLSASYGMLQLRPNHTLETAFHEADLAMFANKQQFKKSA